MESKKEFSTEKLNLFLNKIDKKLDSEQNKDIIGIEDSLELKQRFCYVKCISENAVILRPCALPAASCCREW